MAEFELSQEFKEVLLAIARLAGNLNRKLSIFALVGLIASGYIVCLIYSSEMNLVWNFMICGLVLLPISIIVIVWRTLANLSDAPSHLSTLFNKNRRITSTLKSVRENPKNIRGLISTIRIIRNQEGLEESFSSIGGVTLLINPLFLLITFLSIVTVSILIILAPLLAFFVA